MKIKLLVLVALVFGITIQAQDKVWEKDLKSELHQVGWIKQANEGHIIAAGSKGLLAMNNSTGETVWHNKELKTIDKNTFFTIDGLPFFYVEYSPVAGKKRGLILNSTTGKILFDTKDGGFRVKNYTTFPEKGIILFELLKKKERKLMSFNLTNSEVNWITDLGTASGVFKFLGNSYIDHGPYFVNGNNAIVGIQDEIFSLNFDNGDILWKKQTKKKVKALVSSTVNNSLYIGIKGSSKLTVLNPKNGEDITPGKLKLRGTLIDVVQDSNNNLILVETEGFNIINPETNQFKWKKSFKIDYLNEVIPHEKGMIAIGKDEKKGSIALVSNEGKKIWQSGVNGYAYYITPTSNGVLYISTERSNILDFEKGKDVWEKDVKFKSIPAVTFDTKENKVVLFENKKGYKFDLKTGQINQFADDVELIEVKRKTPLEAEYIEGEGYLLHTDQHISLLKPDGDVKYSQYYKPATSVSGLIGVAELGLAVVGIDLDIQGSINNIKTLSNLSKGVYRNSTDQTDGTTKSSNIVSASVGDQQLFSVTSERYFNSKKTKDSQFIVSKIKKEGQPTVHEILKINKKTGNIDLEIKLLDKTPNYVIDVVDNVVFTNEKNHLISAHKF